MRRTLGKEAKQSRKKSNQNEGLKIKENRFFADRFYSK